MSVEHATHLTVAPRRQSASETDKLARLGRKKKPPESITVEVQCGMLISWSCAACNCDRPFSPVLQCSRCRLPVLSPGPSIGRNDLSLGLPLIPALHDSSHRSTKSASTLVLRSSTHCPPKTFEIWRSLCHLLVAMGLSSDGSSHGDQESTHKVAEKDHKYCPYLALRQIDTHPSVTSHSSQLCYSTFSSQFLYYPRWSTRTTSAGVTEAGQATVLAKGSIMPILSA